MGCPAIKAGEVYSFAFALVGGGAGCVVGVADASWRDGSGQASDATAPATAPAAAHSTAGGLAAGAAGPAAAAAAAAPAAVAAAAAAPAAAPSAQDADPTRPVAWGLNLSHGALYTKHAGKEGQGELSAQQLLAVPPVGLVRGRSPPIILEVEVDARSPPFKLGFGLADGPMVHAVAAHVDCAVVVPWVYFWGGEDAVVLLPRKQPKQPRMQPPSASLRTPISFRSSPPPSPVRAANAPQASPQPLPARPTTSQQQHRPSRLRRASTDRGGVRERRSSLHSRRPTAGGEAAAPGASGSGSGSGAGSGAGAGDDLLETLSLSDGHTSASSSTVSGNSIWQPPRRGGRAASVPKRQLITAPGGGGGGGGREVDPHEGMYAMRVHEERRTQSPERRPTSNKPRSWDIVRRVTSTYNDVFAQLGASAQKVERKLPKQERPGGNASGFFSIA